MEVEKGNSGSESQAVGIYSVTETGLRSRAFLTPIPSAQRQSLEKDKKDT